MNKNIESYFTAARQAPLTLSMEDIRSQVEVYQYGTISNKGFWKWSLNSIVLILGAAILGSVLIFSMPDSPKTISKDPGRKVIFPTVFPEDSLTEEELESKEEVLPVDEVSENALVSEQEKSNVQELSEAKTADTERKKHFRSAWMPEVNRFQEKGEKPDGEFDNGSLGFERNGPQAEGAELSQTDLVQEDTILNGSKEIIRSIEVSPGDWLVLSHSYGRVDVVVGDQNRVLVKAIVSVEGKSEEDEELAMSEMDFTLSKSGNKVQLDPNWKDMITGDCNCSVTKISKKNKKKEKIKLKKVKVRYEIEVPEYLNLDMSNKYAGLYIPDMSGEWKLNNFQGNIEAGSNQSRMELTVKYGKATLGDSEWLRATLFQSNLFSGNSKEVSLNIKYGKAQIGSSNRLRLEAFQSNVTQEGVSGRVSGEMKYGNYNWTGSLETLSFSIFQGKLNGGDVSEARLSASYSTISLNDLNTLDFDNLFQSKVNVGSVDEIAGGGKYTNLSIGKLNRKINWQAFQGRVDVEQVSPGFKSVEVDAKYSPVQVNFDPNSNYKLEASSNYSSIAYPANDFVVSLEKQVNQSREVHGVFGKNANSEELSYVFVRCFQGRISLK